MKKLQGVLNDLMRLVANKRISDKISCVDLSEMTGIPSLNRICASATLKELKRASDLGWPLADVLEPAKTCYGMGLRSQTSKLARLPGPSTRKGLDIRTMATLWNQGVEEGRMKNSKIVQITIPTTISMSRRQSKVEEEDAWVFDSLVGFLRGPVWNVPILTFIEHKSLIFEPDMEENEMEDVKIHEEYKNLVDFMLGSYMEDIGISPDQFEKACGVASTKIKSQFHHTLFEQVWAADDFEIFKRMMIQKNIELQLQALELLQQRYGVLPLSLTPSESTEAPEEATEDDSEKKLMEEVTKKSMAEHKANESRLDDATKAMEEAMANSGQEIKRLEAQRTSQHNLLAEHFKSKVAINDPSVVMRPPGPVRSESPDPPAETTIDEEELQRRTEFLRSQRDKLLAMKKEERERQLAEAEKEQMKTRPKSARAARSAFGRGRPATGAGIDPQTLKVRRALAEKLKQEVIGRQQ
eukprot:maker-scaffold526_size146413-snap-gene-0.21 protein:Tk11265 transcript:maker-scaffold526_size146413-snap-gene-0.21-mRNA-1 annotation:"coiled-coil domain-containing protein 104"